ncbi:AMP-binding protein, partial [Streptomyces sp. CHB19.2]|uniref:AMP-binding protein n=1 Tax=Streptomyces sp. CHB19.2 TaxID=2841671 RepID=UPI002094818F
RDDYTTAYEGFRWPRPDRFNWALDWFDVIADGNDRTALHLVEEDGGRTRLSFADLARRSDQVANWLRQQGVEAEDRVRVMLGNQAE